MFLCDNIEKGIDMNDKYQFNRYFREIIVFQVKRRWVL